MRLRCARRASFSALQRAEIAEIFRVRPAYHLRVVSFSALQRAEIAEISFLTSVPSRSRRFSALQRAEIAEIVALVRRWQLEEQVSVLFNEPKLLKYQMSVYM